MSPQDRSLSIIPSVDGKAVLLIPDEAGWRIPAHPSASAIDVNGRIEETYGIRVVVLGSLGELLDEEGPVHLLVHENLGKCRPLCSGVRWGSRDDVTRLPFAEPVHRAVAEYWFQAAADGTPRALSKNDWARHGWFAEASDWITEMVARGKARPTGRVEQLKCTSYSVVLRLPTDAGLVYFKAVPEKFAHEPSLAAMLSGRFPNRLPTPLAVDTSRGWLLTRGVDETRSIGLTYADAPLYEEALREYAAIQRELLPDVDDLIALGVPDRRAAALPTLLNDILSDSCGDLVYDGGPLSAGDLAELRAYEPAFRERCERLAQSPLPDTLVNTDFWRHNVLVTKAGYVLLDWAESVVANPLLSIREVFMELAAAQDGADAAGLAPRLLDAYLTEWARYEPLERLRAAYELAQPAAILCRALIWRDSLASLGNPARHKLLRQVVGINLAQLLAFARADGLA